MSKVKFTSVKGSSNISGYHYSEDRLVLTIKFSHGGQYEYHRVSPDVVQEFLVANSKGKFVNSVLKDKYITKKVG
jgi:lysyl-tRNA synthetase class 2